MEDSEIEAWYRKALASAADNSAAIATVKTLLHFLDKDSFTTLQEFDKNIHRAIGVLRAVDPAIEVETVSEIFFRFTTLKASECEVVQAVKENIKKRGHLFLDKVTNCRLRTAKYGHCFISDGSTILVHARSRAVFYTLCEALKENKRFHVYVTQSCPDNTGEEMIKWLQEKKIPCELILDSAIGFYMEKVDMVLVGAEGVVESGGIINKIGTYPMALCAKTINKPFYVLVESYKFVRLYPLNQGDIPDRIKYKKRKDSLLEDQKEQRSLVDYTPPGYITLLLTDLGTLTTAAVSDVLMQLYL